MFGPHQNAEHFEFIEVLSMPSFSCIVKRNIPAQKSSAIIVQADLQVPAKATGKYSCCGPLPASRTCRCEMSAVGPATWRSISRELSRPSLSLRTAFPELAPVLRILQPSQAWRKRSPNLYSKNRPKLQLARFSTASVWAAQVSLKPNDVPISSKDLPSDSTEFRPVPPATVKNVFGSQVDPKKGNDILRELQHQRATGTLDEGIPKCTETALDQGLQWLRSNYPLDEDAAIIARLEREENEESQVLVNRAERLGIYKPTEASEQTTPHIQIDSQDKVIYTPQQDPERNRILGTSLLDKKRLANEAAWEAEQAVKKAEQEAVEAEAIRTGKPVLTAQTQALVRKQKVAEKKAYWLEHAQSAFGTAKKPEEQWPEMTKFQRLWPSAVFTAAVVGLSVLFAHYYTPPPKKARLWPEIPPAAATTLVLIGMNVLICLAWRIVPLQRYLFRNFMTVPGYPRVFTLIGNTFSHQAPWHLTLNMLVLWVFGTRLHDDIGRGPFLATYMSCAALSSFASLTCYVLTNSLGSGALGASGVIAGLMATWCVVNSEYVSFLSS